MDLIISVSPNKGARADIECTCTHKLLDLTLDTTHLEFVPRPETQSVPVPDRGRSVDHSLEKTSCSHILLNKHLIPLGALNSTHLEVIMARMCR